jgi:hypothetical protein
MRKLIAVSLLLLASKGWGAVTVNATATAVDTGGVAVTTATNSSLTIGSGSNRALVCVLEGISAMGSAAITWDTTQNMVLISSYTDSNTQTVSLFGLVNPDSGNKSSVATWTGSTEAFLQCQSYTGVNQIGGTTTFPPAACTHATSAAPSITVTSQTGDETVSGVVSGLSFAISAVSATQLFLNHGAGSIEGGGSYTAGSASNVMTGTLVGSDVWGMCATDILQATVAPTVTTQSPTTVTKTTATGNGTSTSNGGASITDEGICVGASPNPTTGCVSSGSTATAAFTSSLTGLTTGTQYWANAYATNSVGTSYGNDNVSFGTLWPSGVTSSGSGGKMTITGSGGQMKIQ